MSTLVYDCIWISKDVERVEDITKYVDNVNMQKGGFTYGVECVKSGLYGAVYFTFKGAEIHSLWDGVKEHHGLVPEDYLIAYKRAEDKVFKFNAGGYCELTALDYKARKVPQLLPDDLPEDIMRLVSEMIPSWCMPQEKSPVLTDAMSLLESIEQRVECKGKYYYHVECLAEGCDEGYILLSPREAKFLSECTNSKNWSIGYLSSFAGKFNVEIMYPVPVEVVESLKQEYTDYTSGVDKEAILHVLNRMIAYKKAHMGTEWEDIYCTIMGKRCVTYKSPDDDAVSEEVFIAAAKDIIANEGVIGLVDILVAPTPEHTHGVCKYRKPGDCINSESCENCLAAAMKILFANGVLGCKL